MEAKVPRKQKSCKVFQKKPETEQETTTQRENVHKRHCWSKSVAQSSQKKFFKSNSKKRQPDLKMGKVGKQVNSHRTKEDARMTDKHLKVFDAEFSQESCKYKQQVTYLPKLYHHQMLMETGTGHIIRCWGQHKHSVEGTQTALTKPNTLLLRHLLRCSLIFYSNHLKT